MLPLLQVLLAAWCVQAQAGPAQSVLQPDLILGGHSFVMDHPKGLIDRFYQWSLAMRDAYKGLSAEEDYRTMFDPYWVRVDPYRVRLAPGGIAPGPGA